MNVFIIDSNVEKSSEEFARIDPKRARKQLVECCQVLAYVDYHHFATTWMIRGNGERYKLAKSHKNHPIVLAAVRSKQQFDLTCEVTRTLSTHFPNHRCVHTYQQWLATRPLYTNWDSVSGLTSCRTGYPLLTGLTIERYAELMRQYVLNKLAND